MTMSAHTAYARMDAETFVAWAMERPEGVRYELAAGEVDAMAPERSVHALVKARIWRALDAAAIDAGLPCTAYSDGTAVRVDEATVYEPDTLVRCGEQLPDDAVQIIDPMIVVEVPSPPIRARDAAAKLQDYFRLSSVRHYLIVKTENCTVIHHRLDDDESIATRILRGGELELAPPGLRMTVESFFP